MRERIAFAISMCLCRSADRISIVKLAKTVTTPVDVAIEIAVHAVYAQMYLGSAPPKHVISWPVATFMLSWWYWGNATREAWYDKVPWKKSTAQSHTWFTESQAKGWRRYKHRTKKPDRLEHPTSSTRFHVSLRFTRAKMTLRRIKQEWLNLQNAPLL